MQTYCKMEIFFVILIFGIFLQQIPNTFQANAPEIEISTGKIKGEEKESRNDKYFFAYRGILYATAKRFEPPQRPGNWSGVRDAEEYGKKCIQYSTFEKKVVGSEEECLCINVFTPKVDGGLSKKLLPVMVFISPNFLDGTADIYRPHYFMDFQNIVVVTFNFRLNIFGFLSTGDDVVPGNLGLKDQVHALKWTQENIRRFSGDPKKVCIFGAGSSVQLLMLSPLANGLFQKAISQSSSALKLSTIQKHPKQAAQIIARLMNCEKVLNETVNATKMFRGQCLYENSSLILECLKLVDGKKLAEVQKDAFEILGDPLAFFGPVIEFPGSDQSFLREHPYSIISKGRQNRVPWIVGLNAMEGLMFTYPILNDKSLVDNLNGNWPILSSKFLKYDGARTDITNRIRGFYLNNNTNHSFFESQTEAAPFLTNSITTIYPSLNFLNQSITIINSANNPPTHSTSHDEEMQTINFEEQFNQFTDMFTDRFYAVGMINSIRMQSKFSSVYAYYNAYEGQFSMLDVYSGKTKEPAPALKKITSWFKRKILGRPAETQKHLGVCHQDELPLLFKYPNLKIKTDSKDYEMSKDLVKLWIQFATDEKNMAFRGSSWLPVNPNNGDIINVMKFGNNESGFGSLSQSFMKRINFWSNLEYLASFDQ